MRRVRFLSVKVLLFSPPLPNDRLTRRLTAGESERNMMKLSARNILKGKVKSLKTGPISSLVVLEIAPGIEIVSTITAGSSANLKLRRGQTAYAIIKASSVLIGVDD
jgi:molybdopterin-binding protein